jgi:hypothetical protein
MASSLARRLLDDATDVLDAVLHPSGANFTSDAAREDAFHDKVIKVPSRADVHVDP